MVADRLGTDNGPLAAALDHCLGRLRQGDSIDACLADYPPLADQLWPLLSLARTLFSEVRAAPRAGLDRPGARFLEAAAAMRERQMGQAAELDSAVEALRAGQKAGQLAPDVRPLVEFAERLMAEVVTPPLADAALARARQRVLLAARLAETSARAQEPRPRALALSTRRGRWSATLRSWLAPRTWSPAPRLAAVVVTGLALVLVANALVAPKVMASVPGDTFYGWKLLGENVRLAFAFDPVVRLRLQAEISQERARELAVVSRLGRVAQITWRVRLVAVEIADPARPAVGRLLVAPLAGGADSPSAVVVWNEGTEWILGDLVTSIAALPVGSELELRLRLRGPHEPPLLIGALLVDVAAASQPAATPTSETPGPSMEAPSATPLPATATETPAPNTLTPLPSASPTMPSNATSTAAAVSARPEEPQREEPLKLLRGTVRSKSDSLWEIADDGQSGRLVSADVSQLSPADRERVRPGDWVRLVGRWRGHGTFIAEDLDDYRPWESRCTRHEAIGDVVEFTPGSWLRLSTGQGFRLSRSGAAVGSGLVVGSYVQVTWLDCGSGDIRVLEVKVLRRGSPETATGTPAPRGPYQGTVQTVVDSSSFRLAADDGSYYTVRYDAQTPIVGAATEIRQGQEVGIYGWLEGSELRAQRIEVYRDVATVSPTATSASAFGAIATVAPTPVASQPPSAAAQ